MTSTVTIDPSLRASSARRRTCDRGDRPGRFPMALDRYRWSVTPELQRVGRVPEVRAFVPARASMAKRRVVPRERR